MGIVHACDSMIDQNRLVVCIRPVPPVVPFTCLGSFAQTTLGVSTVVASSIALSQAHESTSSPTP